MVNEQYTTVQYSTAKQLQLVHIIKWFLDILAARKSPSVPPLLVENVPKKQTHNITVHEDTPTSHLLGHSEGQVMKRAVLV